MYLIQILLPLQDNGGNPFANEDIRYVRDELTARFGGVTAFRRAPAEGAWKADDGSIARDEVIIVEVMANTLDRAWWHGYRLELELRFRQDEIVVRAHPVTRL
jgi:hypothetical protein